MPRETPVPEPAAQPEPTTEEIQEKVERLNNMGFLGEDETLRICCRDIRGIWRGLWRSS
jgi:hypothetical protein